MVRAAIARKWARFCHSANANPKEMSFTVDVAVDHGTFAIIPSTGLVLNPQAPGPNRGTTFIVDGTVFPGGTLEKGTGLGDPGQPGAIGVWSCKGFFTSVLGTEDVGFNTNVRGTPNRLTFRIQKH